MDIGHTPWLKGRAERKPEDKDRSEDAKRAQWPSLVEPGHVPPAGEVVSARRRASLTLGDSSVCLAVRGAAVGPGEKPGFLTHIEERQRPEILPWRHHISRRDESPRHLARTACAADPGNAKQR